MTLSDERLADLGKQGQLLEQKANSIANEIGTDDFTLFGGALMHYLGDGTPSVNDIDIAVCNAEQFQIVTRTLLQNDFTYESPPWRAFTRVGGETWNVALIRDSECYDITLIEDCSEIGLFYLDGVRLQFPSRKVIGRTEAFNDLRMKLFRPLPGLSTLDPCYVFQAICRISRKYGFWPQNEEQHVLTWDLFNEHSTEGGCDFNESARSQLHLAIAEVEESCPWLC